MAASICFLSVVGLECGAYYTCRHTYEPTLIAELATAGIGGAVYAHPGVVYTPGHSGRLSGAALVDPVYALQVVPDVRIVRSESTTGIARAALAILASRGDDGQGGGAWEGSAGWDIVPHGSLAVHALVPDMCKGSPKPKMSARVERVAELVRDGMRKRHRFARPCDGHEAPAGGAPSATSGAPGAASERWLLQLLLLEADTLAISLCRCRAMGPIGGCWPNWRRPAGLASEALAPSSSIGAMPSSAYRKLLEALDCMGAALTPGQTVVDLGASPGSWTAALRKHDCAVIAVDRSPLDSALMADPRVTFVEGDAFSFSPLEARPGWPGASVDWLVSDVIAYPERVFPLLQAWCGGRWATEGLIVTMKFKGQEPHLAALSAALDAARALGYAARAKHFFSNKNEVTIMLAPSSVGEEG